MAEIPTKEQIIKDGEQRIADKAEAEKRTDFYTSQYESLTNRIREKIPQIIEGAHDEMMGLYVDNWRNNGKKSEGFGTELYNKLNSYVYNKVFAFKGADSEEGKEALEKIVSKYIGVDSPEEFNKLLGKQKKVPIMVFDALRDKIGVAMQKRLGNEVGDRLQKYAKDNFEGLKKYTVNLAKEEGISFTDLNLHSIEELINLFIKAANEPVIKKMKGLNVEIEE